jgi:diguanylate cyclase (GGDEF)-like protein
MRIASKIILGYLALGLFVCLVGLLGFLELGKIGREFDRALNQTQPIVDALREMNDQARQVQLMICRLVMDRRDAPAASRPDHARQAVTTGAIDQALHALDQACDQHRSLVKAYFPDEIGLSEEIESRVAKIRAVALAAANRDGSGQGDYLAMEEAVQALREATREGLDEESEEFTTYQQSVDETVWQHRLNVLLGALLALTAGLVGGALLTRQIAGPIIRLRNAVRRFGQGELTLRVAPEATDEIGDLAETFNAMAETLGGTMVTRDYVENIIESMSDGIVVLDPEFQVRRLNSAARSLLAKGSGELTATPAGDLFPEAASLLKAYQRYGSCPALEITIAIAQGPLRHLRIVTTPLTELGHSTGILLLIHDITPQKSNEERLRTMANYDTLTGLANRNMLALFLGQGVARLPWSGRFAAVLFCDLDRFKMINDSLGHTIGDELLQQVAARFKTLMRAGDMVFRLGGDEFVILLLEMAGLYDICHLADRIVRGITQPFRVGTHELRVTTSIGISMAPVDGHDADELLKNADLAMYEAKRMGKNRFCFFSRAMAERTQERMLLETALHRAISQGRELVVFYQPQVTILGELQGFEALVRWQSPDRGLVSPMDFLPAAVEAGWMGMLDEWVLRRACQAIGQWRQSSGAGLRVAVNISDQMFKRPDFCRLVAQVLEESQLPAQALELELTEAVVMTEVEQAITTMNALCATGVTLSIDDFGTGYSSFGQLKRCPIQTLKIDRSFVRDLVDNPNDVAIVEAIIAMALRLGITSLAEGVETEEQLAILRRSGCQCIQGYLFGRPMPADEVPALLARMPLAPEKK